MRKLDVVIGNRN